MAKSESLDTRDRLLETAASLMWERSFQATGVDELCQRAKAQKGSFYHFFPSKTDLAVASIENTWAQAKKEIFEPIFSGNGSGLDQLRKLVDAVINLQTAMAAKKGAFLGCPFGNLGQEMARQDDRIRATLETIFDAHCKYIESALNRAQQAGEIPKGNNRQRAKNIFALLEGAQLVAKVSNDPKVLRDAKAAVLAIAGV